MEFQDGRGSHTAQVHGYAGDDTYQEDGVPGQDALLHIC